MCFCLLPVTGSNLNLFLLREVVKKRILENLCDVVDFLHPKLVKLKRLVVCLLQVNRASRFGLTDQMMRFPVGEERHGWSRHDCK